MLASANPINVIVLIVLVALADPADVRIVRRVSCAISVQDYRQLTGAYDLLHRQHEHG